MLLKDKRVVYTENKLIEKFDCKLLDWNLFRKKQPNYTTEVTADILVPHFQALLTSDKKTLELTENFAHYETWCDDLFTYNEISSLINQTKNGKATGPDLLSYEEIKQSYNILESEWEMLYNRCLIDGKIPEKWKNSNMHMLYKGIGEIIKLNNYRGIALQQTAYKCLTKLLNNRLLMNLHDKLPPEQHGFIPGKSTTTPIGEIINDVKAETSKKVAKYTPVLSTSRKRSTASTESY